MKAGVITLVLMLVILGSVPGTRAVSESSVSSAESTIQGAFVVVQNAESQGGNVTSLVGQLNDALTLVQRALAENSTNPSQATADLQSAIVIAQQVAADAPAVEQSGLASRQAQEYVSIGSAIAVVTVAALIYVYGERIYRRIWLRLYSDHVVKKVG